MPFRRIWTEDQDKMLKYLRQDLSIEKWSIIAQKLQHQYGIIGRNQKQCRQRYHNHLDSSLNVSKISSHEEKLLLMLHNRLGNRWAQISKHFTGRTDAYLKNLFHSKIRKAVRKLNRYGKQNVSGVFLPFFLKSVCRIMENSHAQNEVQLAQVDSEGQIFRKLQHGLIQYSGSGVSCPMFNQWTERETFDYLSGLLERTVDFQHMNPGFEAEQLSQQSEYYPSIKKKSLDGKKKNKQNSSKCNGAWEEIRNKREIDSGEDNFNDEEVREGVQGESQGIFTLGMPTQTQLPQSQLLQIQHKKYICESILEQINVTKDINALRKVLREISSCQWKQRETQSICERAELIDWENLSIESPTEGSLFDLMVEGQAMDFIFS